MCLMSSLKGGDFPADIGHTFTVFTDEQAPQHLLLFLPNSESVPDSVICNYSFAVYNKITVK